MRNVNYDKYYLQQTKQREPKETLKFIAQKAAPFIGQLSSPEIGDIGCATGDFLYYLHSLYPDAKFTGLDYDKELLAAAKKTTAFADFIRIDICDRQTLPDKKFDVLFMSGIHFYYDDIALWSSNFMHLLKPGGRGYVFGTFNSENLDVLSKVRYADKSDEYHTYGNLFSIYTLKKEFAKLNAEISTYDFDIHIDVPKNEQDPLRSWTIIDNNNKRMIVNGIQVIQTYKLAEIIPLP